MVFMNVRATARGLATFAAVFVLTSCAQVPDHQKLRLTVLDVGQGDCLLVETPSHRTMLIDGGGSNDDMQVDPRQVGLKTIIPYLHYRGINSLDLIVLSHPHSDHVGGLSSVLREVKVGAVLDGDVLDNPTPSYKACLDVIRAKHIPYRHAVRGTHIDFQDGVSGDFLNPPNGGAAYGTDTGNDTMNNYSAVLRLTYGKTHFLLDGDAENEAEADMLAHGEDVEADVLKCGHHGAGNATSDAWLSRVHPRFAAISCGLRNTFGHPNPGTIERLHAHGVQTFRTDLNGAIIFESDGQAVTAAKTIEHERR